MTWWRRWDAEVVSLIGIALAVVMMWSQFACTAPVVIIQPRPPTPGVRPHPYPAHWNEPAVLCVNHTKLAWAGMWGCR